MINNSFHRHVWFHNNGNVFTRNIVTQPYPKPIGDVRYGAMIDCNVFTDSLSLQKAQEYGTDTASIVANVRFVNAAKCDFRIDDSCTEIFKLGFQNFAMDRFGVVSPRLKALAATPKIPVPIFLAATSSVDIITWESIQLKNLTTLGERSATGMDAERGVYVVAVGAYGNELRDYLKSNDVILGFAGKDVNNLDDLRKAVVGADLSKPQQMVVFRNQQKQTLTVGGGIIKSVIK